jgi:hypothetical protein
MTAADWIVAGGAAVAFVGLVYFVVRYAVSTEGDWRLTPAGRHLMFFRGSLAAFMAMVAIHNLATDYPGRDVVRVIVVCAFALATLQGDRLLEKAQKAHKAALKARRAQDRTSGR